MDAMKALEAQVEGAVEKYLARHGEFVNSLMEEMKASNLPPSIAGTAMIMVLTDASAKLNSMLTETFHQDINVVAENAGETLKKVIKTYYKMMVDDIGGHNVHADPVGETLPPSGPQG